MYRFEMKAWMVGITIQRFICFYRLVFGAFGKCVKKIPKIFRSAGYHFFLDAGSNGSVSPCLISLRTFVASLERDS